jgi:hypothetical protein
LRAVRATGGATSVGETTRLAELAAGSTRGTGTGTLLLAEIAGRADQADGRAGVVGEGAGFASNARGLADDRLNEANQAGSARCT